LRENRFQISDERRALLIGELSKINRRHAPREERAPLSALFSADKVAQAGALDSLFLRFNPFVGPAQAAVRACFGVGA
jgi:hypothetical protein